MRVVHVYTTIDLRAGGIIAAIDGLTRAQVKAGLEVCLVANWWEGDDLSLRDRLTDQNVGVELIGPCKTPLGLHPQLRPVVDRMVGKADIVHVHAVWEQIQHVAARTAWRRRVPYIITPHGMLDRYSLGVRWLKKRLYRSMRLDRNLKHANAIHFHTQIEQDLVVGPAGTMKLKVPVIVEPSGLDLTEFQQLPPAGAFRRRYEALADRPIVLFLSRVHPKKGLDLLVPAFAGANVGDAALVIAGPDDGGYRAQVEKMVEAHGLSDRVVFTGMLHDAQRIEAMVDADLFVLPSYQENFGMVVVESLAAGTPVIISNQVNLHPQITAAQVGEVVATDAAEVARAIERWLSDSEMRLAAAERTRRFARQNYDWNVIAQHWAQHYGRVVALAGSDRPDSGQ